MHCILIMKLGGELVEIRREVRSSFEAKCSSLQVSERSFVNDPATAELLSGFGGGRTASEWIKYKVAGLG